MSEAVITTAGTGTHRRTSKITGAALIVAGTTIGAGMFSLPVVSSGMWFGWSLITLMVACFCMLTSGLYLLEVNLQYPAGASFDTMAQDTLGNTGRIINGLSVAFVCYILTYAYISGGSSIVSHSVAALTNYTMPSGFASLFFAAGLVVFVVIGTKAVDRLTTIMLGGMMISFLMFTTGLANNASADNLFPALELSETAPFALMALPFMVVSFGFHNCVPSIVKYMDKDAKGLRSAILLGAGLVVAFYLVWQVSIMGNLNRDALQGVIAEGGNIGAFLRALEVNGVSMALSGMLQIFSNLAVATSFLGVSLSLFDYLSDALGFDDSLMGRMKTAAVTFVPPTVLGIMIPDGFIRAIGFAGVAATIFTMIVPVLMVMKLRQRGYNNVLYRVSGGKGKMIIVFLFGLSVLGLEVLNLMGLLPNFS